MLELSDINSYYGDSHVLQDMSMNIEENEIVGLLGRNGMGKTTTLRTIVGLVKPRSGQIKYKGDNITGLPPNTISSKGISLVPEERRIFPNLTVRENLQIAKEGKKGTEADITFALDIFPDIEEILNQPGRTLSGGQRQMVAIGRALIGEVDLLLLDEPMEGLAPFIVEKVVDSIEEISKETTICLVEQNVLHALDIVDRAYIIDKGQIVYSGSATEIRQDDNLLDEYLGISM